MNTEVTLTSLALVEQIIHEDVAGIRALLDDMGADGVREVAMCVATFLGGHLQAVHGDEEAALNALSKWRALALRADQ